MISLNSIFKDIYSTKKRYILITGGRGSSKSFTISTFATQLTYEKSQRILFTRYTMSSAEISIIPEFKDKIERLNVVQDFKVNATDITNIKTKSDILFRGIKASSGMQTANLKSIAGISTWINDESEELVDEEVFNTIDLSIRTAHLQNTIILILNPSNKDHWIYKRWIQRTNEIRFIDGFPVEISTHPDVLHIHTTYLDNLKNLDANLVDQIRQKKEESPKWYGHKIIGQWSEIAEGSIFDTANLNFYKHDPLLKFETSFAYIDVADEGTDFLAMIVGRNIGSKVYITDVVFSDKNSDVTIPLCVSALKLNEVKYCRIESNNMGAIYSRQIAKEVQGCSVLPVNNSTNKHTRILMSAPFVYSHFHFKHESERNGMYQAFMSQLYQYTKDGKAKHDDSADAVSGLSIFVKSMMSKYY